LSVFMLDVWSALLLAEVNNKQQVAFQALPSLLQS